MNDRIKYVTDELGRVVEDVRANFGALTEEQLNWKPAADSWSVAQCLDHLLKTNEQFYPEFAKLASGNRKNTFWQNYSPFTGMGGRFLVNAVMNDSKKVKAPSKDIVPPSDIEDGIVEKFTANIKDVCDKIEACSSADLKKTVVTSPFLSVMTYTLDDAYSVLVEHSKRHIRQAKWVMDTTGFPKPAAQQAAV
jgi:hypothetical protein